MIKQLLAVAVVASGIFFASSPAQAAVVYVTTAPPVAIVERVPARPGPGYAWVPGHYRWNGSTYVWMHGHYERHAGSWCNGHWAHTSHGYYWVEGHWC
jgi:hypothetical protein